MRRRAFLIGSGATVLSVAAGATVGRWLDGGSSPGHAASGQARSTEAAGRGGPLVLVALYGGNDGLNTVVPYSDPAYRSARPTLGYDAGQVLPLADGLGLNPQLKGLHELWGSGQLAVVRGVGYPNPNLSHFASMDIWQTANPTDGTGPGWIGKWLDHLHHDPMRAISVGPTLPPALRGEKESASAVIATRVEMPGDTAFHAAYAEMQAAGPDRDGLMAEVARSGADLLAVGARLDGLAPAGTSGRPPSSHTASGSALQDDLSIVAALVNAGAPTDVYHVSLSSFDTHASEKANHERLLGELDAAVTGFLQAVHSRRVTVMTYSEFGRRPAENASGGTDHGSAAPVLLMGPGVRGGRFYGEEPSLTDLDANGNLKFGVDFRSVYATVLGGVLGSDPAPVLGGSFPLLSFV